MNDDELKQLWQQQPLRKPDLSEAQLLAAMQNRTTLLRQCVEARDFRELAVCGIMVIVFGWFYFTVYSGPISRVGDLIIIGSLFYIAFKLVYTRRLTPPAPPGATVIESLRAELAAVRAQSRLLGSVLWWYVLPPTLGMVIATWGLPIELSGKITSTLFFAGVGAFIVWLNRWARAKQLLPLEAQLASLLRSAETGEPFDQTHVANLRPVVVSLAAADRVKPVDFKVAFWQLALFGVPGIVGIWFFWMLGQTHFNLHRMFTPRNLAWGATSFLGGLLYSWLIQKTTHRAVGISPLGIHLLKGQTLILWDEIKEVRPFKFLHVQNLDLITESGEKTRMHWTPLERHADLKAAVEKYAPAGHPIRKHLALLRTGNLMMTILLFLSLGLLTLASLAYAFRNTGKSPALVYAEPGAQALEAIRQKHKFPALAAAVVVDGKIVATNAAGFRRHGADAKVAVDDKFHLGSVTKSMTATVAAMLVEQGKISWTTTIGSAFPELKRDLHADYLDVTLEQLLSHRGGAPGKAPTDLWQAAWAAQGTPAEQRLAFVKGLLARQPEAKPGTKHLYSNQGYAIAGVMLERAAGKSWEDLLRTMLFEPLGMTTAGFGAPASPDQLDQPWGHEGTPFSNPTPVPPGPRADNPLAISPAGAVHCSLGDLAKYAAFHMAGERGESSLLKADSFKKLHTAIPDNQDYALGWIVLKRGWANGRALMHNGSNTMFYVVLWMAPDKNCAVMVASNIGMDAAFEGCDEAAGNLIRQYFPK